MSNKHDANVRKSTWLNFQIGLVASLLFTYVMFEVYTTEVKRIDPYAPVTNGIQEPDWNPSFQVYQAPKPKVVAHKISQKRVDPNKFKIIKNTEVISKAKVVSSTLELPKVTSTSTPGFTAPAMPIKKKKIAYNLRTVEFVPIFPGCEKLDSNKARAECFSERVKRLVSRKFNSGLGEELGLKGIQRIAVEFEVGEQGYVQNIRARAAHPRLEKEAKRVVKKFPKMTPGKQRGRNVVVKYQLPIIFQIQN